MGFETNEQNFFQSEIYVKLKEAEYQAQSTKKRYTHEEVMAELHDEIQKSKQGLA